MRIQMGIKQKDAWKKAIKILQKKWKKRFENFSEKHSNKYLCKCGCSNFIIIKRHHIRQGIPSFLPNHHSRMSLKGKTHSLQSRKNMSLGHTKEKRFNGFKTKMSLSVRNSAKYKEWRLMVFGRDNFTCRMCDVRGGYLEAHHKQSFSSILTYFNIKDLKQANDCEQLWDINNGISLCTKCHKKTDRHRR